MNHCLFTLETSAEIRIRIMRISGLFEYNGSDASDSDNTDNTDLKFWVRISGCPDLRLKC